MKRGGERKKERCPGPADESREPADANVEIEREREKEKERKREREREREREKAGNMEGHAFRQKQGRHCRQGRWS